MIRLSCPVQNYAWGKQGQDSLVFQLKSSSEDSSETDISLPYAELWMGTHPSGSALCSSGESLLSLLKANKELVGIVPTDYEPFDLPFLFKVLSIRTALSIQAHPNKELAMRLHATYPDVYKDPNHKPEMVIALGDFECLSGFRHKPDITNLLKEYPEFTSLLMRNGFDNVAFEALGEEEYIRSIFVAYANCKSEDVSLCLGKLFARLKVQDEDHLDVLQKLLLRLGEQYPDDIGVLAPLLLNYLHLKNGDSFFIGPNVPHAYISGDCVECMALSDNVVRAGLTPKLRDVETLISMLEYNSGVPSFIEPVQLDAFTQLYRPPKLHCAEFEVERICLSPGQVCTLRRLDTASIVIVLTGDNVDLTLTDTATLAPEVLSLENIATRLRLHRGHTFLLAAGASVGVATDANAPGVILFRAHVNLE